MCVYVSFDEFSSKMTDIAPFWILSPNWNFHLSLLWGFLSVL